MGGGELVELECRLEALSALAAGLDRFGPVEGEPAWLVSAVWLCVDAADYIATPSTKVLSDGYIARPLTIDRIDDFVRQLKGDVPDIAGRLVGRNGDVRLPEPARPQPPSNLERSPGPPRAAMVLIRVAARAATEHRVACGLLFSFEGHRLLVGTDPATMAMVLSVDEQLIDRYAADCESVPVKDYLERLNS